MGRIILILAILLTSATAAGTTTTDDPFPAVAASYLLRIDGKTVWAHRADRRLPPASLTKIMTALIVLEREDPGRVVTVSRGAAAESRSRIGLHRGDRLTVRDLLAATLIYSANDACRALADHVGGDRERFVGLMNAKAKEMGLSDTHFNDPCGHDQPRHFSSARDLAILAETALGNRAFRELVSMQGLEIRTVDGKRRFRLKTKNLLLGRYPGAVGVKTGYTGDAGKCIIALAERGSTRVLLVMLHARDRWHDAAAMLDRAFHDSGRASFGNRSSSSKEKEGEVKTEGQL
jgi:D-alanyl-D-alanine carboxypeptidase (penicillin-binding protein 5/6)